MRGRWRHALAACGRAVMLPLCVVADAGQSGQTTAPAHDLPPANGEAHTNSSGSGDIVVSTEDGMITHQILLHVGLAALLAIVCCSGRCAYVMRKRKRKRGRMLQEDSDGSQFRNNSVIVQAFGDPQLGKNESFHKQSLHMSASARERLEKHKADQRTLRTALSAEEAKSGRAAPATSSSSSPPLITLTVRSNAHILRGGSSPHAAGSKRMRASFFAKSMMRKASVFLGTAVNLALDVPVEEMKMQVAQKVDKRRSILMGRYVKKHNPKMRDHSLKDVSLVASPKSTVGNGKRTLAPKLAVAAQSSPAMFHSSSAKALRLSSIDASNANSGAHRSVKQRVLDGNHNQRTLNTRRTPSKAMLASPLGTQRSLSPELGGARTRKHSKSRISMALKAEQNGLSPHLHAALFRAGAALSSTRYKSATEMRARSARGRMTRTELRARSTRMTSHTSHEDTIHIDGALDLDDMLGAVQEGDQEEDEEDEEEVEEEEEQEYEETDREAYDRETQVAAQLAKEMGFDDLNPEEATLVVGEAPSKPVSKAQKIACALVPLVFVIAISVAGASIDINAFLVSLKDYPGPLVCLLYIVVMTVGTVFFVPALVLTLAAGVIFRKMFGKVVGIAIGSLVVFVGAALGSIAAFFLGRTLFKRRMAIILNDSVTFLAINSALAAEGTRFMLLMRLSPLIPFNAFNYLAGVLQVTTRSYCLGLFGMVPGTVAFVYLGSGMEDVAGGGKKDGQGQIVDIIVWVVGSLFGILGMIMVSRAAKKELRKHLELNFEDDAERRDTLDGSTAETDSNGGEGPRERVKILDYTHASSPALFVTGDKAFAPTSPHATAVANPLGLDSSVVDICKNGRSLDQQKEWL